MYSSRDTKDNSARSYYAEWTQISLSAQEADVERHHILIIFSSNTRARFVYYGKLITTTVKFLHYI